MAQIDALRTLNLRRGSRLSSKETLNHPELMRHLSGKHPFKETEEACLVSIERLGIDLVTESPSSGWRIMEPLKIRLKLGETMYKVIPGTYHPRLIK